VSFLELAKRKRREKMVSNDTRKKEEMEGKVSQRKKTHVLAFKGFHDIRCTSSTREDSKRRERDTVEKEMRSYLAPQL